MHAILNVQERPCSIYTQTLPKILYTIFFCPVLFSLFFNIGSGFATSWIRRDEVVLIYKEVIWAIEIVLNSPLDKVGERGKKTRMRVFPCIQKLYISGLWCSCVLYFCNSLDERFDEKRTHEHHFDKFPIILSTLVMNQYTGADSWKCPREGIRWKFLFPFEAEGGGDNFIIEWMWIHPHQTSRLSFTLEISK